MVAVPWRALRSAARWNGHPHQNTTGVDSTPTAQAQPGACDLRVTDNGRAFDPTTATPRTDGASLDQATPGGLGLVLLARYASGLGYRRLPGGNQLDLSIPYPLPPSGTLR